MFDLAAHEAAEVADRGHGRRHSRQPQDCPHYLITAQPLDMRKAPTPGQHSGKKRQHHVDYRDLIGLGAAVGREITN